MPDALGPHDSVFKWCLEWCGMYHAGSVANPRGPALGSSRVIRGGDRHDGGSV